MASERAIQCRILRGGDVTDFNPRQTIFGTPVYVLEHPFREDAERLNERLLADVVQWAKEDPEGHSRSNCGPSWHSTVHPWEREAFIPLVERVLKAGQGIFGDEKMPEGRVKLTEMWANVHRRGGWNAPHRHVGGLWSGVYFVSAPPGSGNLILMDPRNEVGETFRVRPEPGRFVIFPEWLHHMVEPHEGDDPRVSISFNFTHDTGGGPTAPSHVNIPNVLSKEDLMQVYTMLAGRGWQRGRVGAGEVSDRRTNDVLFVAGTDDQWAWLYDIIEVAADMVNEQTYHLDIDGGGDMQFARYGPGQKYEEHTDRGQATPGAANRTLSVAITLSPAEKGGGTHFPKAKEQPAHQSAGDAVFFPATELHAALPVEEGVRDSLIVWFRERG